VTHAAATSERFAYKVSGGFLTQEAFLRPSGTIPGSNVPYPAFDNRGTRQPRLDARVDYDLAEPGRSLVLAGGITGTEGMIHTGLGPLDIQRGSTLKYGRVAYTRGRFKLRGFVNALDGNVRAALLDTPEGAPFESSFENQAYDVEASDLRLAGSRHVVSYGGNYRYNNFDISMAPRGTHRSEGGGYGAGRDRVLRALPLDLIGLRLDAFDVLKKVVLSPRTTLLVKPRPEHNDPAIVQPGVSRALLRQQLSRYRLCVPDGCRPGGRSSPPLTAVGNDQLREEALTAYEVAYSAAAGRFTGGAALYVNRVSNAIQFAPTSQTSFSYLNFDRITDRGFELTGEMRVTAALSAFANYSWQDEPSASGVDLSELNVPPRHRVNAGVSATHGRYFGRLSGSFVDAAYCRMRCRSYVGYTEAYTLVDGSVGVHSSDRRMTVTARGHQPAQIGACSSTHSAMSSGAASRVRCGSGSEPDQGRGGLVIPSWPSEDETEVP
jgi:hypothetical protein